MNERVRQGLDLIAAQQDALLAGDAPAADLTASRLREWLGEFGKALREGSIEVSPNDLASLRSRLEANALIAGRRASAASAAHAAIAGATPIYEAAGFSARPIRSGRTLIA